MKELRIALVSIGRVNFDMELAEEITKNFKNNLIMGGLRIVTYEGILTDADSAIKAAESLRKIDFDLLLIFQATFADSTIIMNLVSDIEQPIYLWAIPDVRTGERLRLNSLCGINLAAHALTLVNRKYSYAYAPVDDHESMKQLRTVVGAAAVYRRLKSAKIGLVGEHPDGMDTCYLDQDALNRSLGVEIKYFNLDEIFTEIKSVNYDKISPVKEKLSKKLPNLSELEEREVEGTLSTYSVLKERIKRDNLEAMAVRCWPEFFTDLKCSACGAISMLTDENIPSSCEADINGTVGQLILQLLSGRPAFGTDIVVVDQENDEVVLWHCGLMPLSYADPSSEPRATVHSNRKLALLMEFSLKPGPITVARLSRASGELTLVAGRGRVLPSSKSFSGTSGVVKFDTPAKEFLDIIMKNGLEHHVSVTYGDYFDELLVLADLLGLPVITL